MFCTSKEQETCDVEKRTCEGCYYSQSKPLDITEIPKIKRPYIKRKDPSVFNDKEDSV